jgi:hypothetical protein
VDFSNTVALPVTTSSFLLALASCLADLPSLLTSLLSLLSILSSRVLASPFSPLGDKASLALARWSRGQASGLERREGRESREQWWPEDRRREEPRLVAEKWLL